MEQQFQLFRQIHRYLDNFKKLGRKNYTSAILRSRIRSLKELWMRFNDDHATLESTVPKAARTTVSYFSDNIYDQAEDSYNLALDHLAVVLEELEPPPSPQRTVDMSYSRASPSAFTSSHLPVIQLAPFDGNVTEWEQFRDRFTAIIIDNKELHDFARMHYLVSFLRGRALDCLSGLAISADNFDLAWQILKDRFDNKRRLISVHMSTLLDLPRLSRESAIDIQTLISKVKLTLASLANLQRSPSDLWNDFLVHVTLQNLDSTTRRAWTLRSHETSDPHSFDSLDRFLAERVRALEDIARESPRALICRPSVASRVHSANVVSPSQFVCPLCQSSHFISSCSRFVGVDVAQRRDIARKHRRCFNCLSPKHSVGECLSKHCCRKCHKRHHTLLHGSVDTDTHLVARTGRANSATIDDRPTEVNALVAAACAGRRVSVLLATARVRVRASTGRTAVVRALIDQGSEITLISERMVQLLKAQHLRMNGSIRAVGCVSAGPVRYAVDLSVSPPRSSSPSLETTAVVLNSLTSYAPRQSIDLTEYEYLSGLSWADPSPFSSDPIDLIIGSDIYGGILLNGVRKGSVGQPVAQQTIFGWIVSGPVGKPGAGPMLSVVSPGLDEQQDIISSCHCFSTLNDELRQFWEVEGVPCHSPRSPEDERCELHFRRTHTRDSDGRYCVRLPFKSDDPIKLGSSYFRAAQSLRSLFRRLMRDPLQRTAYVEFLREYESLGHMRRVTHAPASRDQVVYIPHHPVLRNNNSASALRVVFNASSITSNGTTLNDHILTGPKLQTDLSAVVLRWRNFKFVYCADISKMYRQILLDTRDVDFQRILWSEGHLESPNEYQLLTLTYGMACAPFLALRVLRQLRADDGHEYPLASQILQDNIYVDDVLFGGDSPGEAMSARHQLVSLLQRGCFPLRKWSSNSVALLDDVAEGHRSSNCSRDLSTSVQIRVLGVAWVPSKDAFCFNVVLPDRLPRSKRSILSTIAKLFDPLGWVTPVTIAAKMFIQSLWRCKLTWDETLPSDLLSRWSRTFHGLSHLSGLLVPRWSGFSKSQVHFELHGFADASNSAYAAVVYCKVISASDDVTVTLMTSKSKVAPIRPISVPRLELCAAVTLARLLEFVRESLTLKGAPCYCWSDSQVVLTWLAKHPSSWKTFVAHRVNDIHTRVPDAQWRHVPSADNPADCASRGLIGGDLISHPLWWHGPPWLSKAEDDWPKAGPPQPDDSALEKRLVSLHVEEIQDSLDLFTRFSSWPKAIRVCAYILRFITGCRRVNSSSSTSCVNSTALSFDECAAARCRILRILQRSLFPSEVRLLEKQQPLPAKSSLLPLTPFLDDDGMLRVGGRLSRSPFPFSRCHPILLSHHYITDLIIDHAHLRALHAGIQLTLNVLRQDFWIIRARGAVRRRVHSCVACTRERAATPSQIMSDLPRHRVSAPSRAFLHVGIDYAGPLMVRSYAGRGHRATKSYIALFVCLATRAIHLELASDYSSQAFTNAFSRFCARRGLPRTIYSDNGTTFIGADRELTAAFRSAIRDPNFLGRTATDEIEWRFIPPSAPHFGGLWEAGVKSVKHHLRRVVKHHTLTMEEMSTLLCRIEACVNSRPIAPLSDVRDDYEPLTPGHFLIGTALTTHPEPSLLDVNENRLNRWQLVRHMTERFWHHWYSDYVNLLQQRSKWRQVRPPLRVGQMVLVRNATLPPCKWELGRVTRCHPGADGLIRVITVKTATSELVRPVVRVCVLPVDCDRQ